MKIRLHTFFHFDVARVFGSDWIELPGDTATLGSLLEEVVRRTDKKVNIIDPNGQGIDSDYFVLVNGTEVPSRPESLQRELQEGDEVGVGMMHFWGGG